MEDQRNWTDASFKTYCIPLARPYPVEVEKGTQIRQTVRVRLEGKVPDMQPRQGVRVTVGTQESPFPRLGLQVSSESDRLSPQQVERLAALRLDHLRVSLDLGDKECVSRLSTAASQAARLGVGLHLAIRPADHGEGRLSELARQLATIRAPVRVILLLDASPIQFETVRTRLAPIAGDVRFGVAKDTNFVDLNRDRPTGEGVEVISWAINPQIHAFDNASIVETLPIQGDTVRTARQFAGDRLLAVGPITLRPQQVSPEPPAGTLPADVDPRQASPLLACWTVGSLKYLAEAGVYSVTFYETVGWKGVMELDTPRRSVVFPAEPASAFPVYHVLREAAGYSGGSVRHLTISDPLAVTGLALREGNRLRILLANLTPAEQPVVELQGIRSLVDFDFLDSQTSSKASVKLTGETPLVLPPYGIARADIEIE